MCSGTSFESLWAVERRLINAAQLYKAQLGTFLALETGIKILKKESKHTGIIFTSNSGQIKLILSTDFCSTIIFLISLIELQLLANDQATPVALSVRPSNHQHHKSGREKCEFPAWQTHQSATAGIPLGGTCRWRDGLLDAAPVGVSLAVS